MSTQASLRAATNTPTAERNRTATAAACDAPHTAARRPADRRHAPPTRSPASPPAPPGAVRRPTRTGATWGDRPPVPTRSPPPPSPASRGRCRAAAGRSCPWSHRPSRPAPRGGRAGRRHSGDRPVQAVRRPLRDLRRRVFPVRPAPHGARSSRWRGACPAAAGRSRGGRRREPRPAGGGPVADRVPGRVLDGVRTRSRRGRTVPAGDVHLSADRERVGGREDRATARPGQKAGRSGSSTATPCAGDDASAKCRRGIRPARRANRPASTA
ncbi:hypothetical protein SGRIM128S_02020 [Streptomyces griseomycini]